MSQRGLDQFGAYQKARHLRMKHWLAADVIKNQVELLDEIIGILMASIGTMRKK